MIPVLEKRGARNVEQKTFEERIVISDESTKTNNRELLLPRTKDFALRVIRLVESLPNC